jgi:hypothetical protein
MASKALHAAWRRSIILCCWMEMQGDECSGVVAHALATFPTRMHKAPNLRRVILLRRVPIPQECGKDRSVLWEDYGDCRHLSALGEYPQFRIFILRCYKLQRGGAMRGAWRDDS